MREYLFESVPLARTREGVVPTHDYQVVIRERAAEGWEFVQAVPLESHVPARIDLIFTRLGETS